MITRVIRYYPQGVVHVQGVKTWHHQKANLLTKNFTVFFRLFLHSCHSVFFCNSCHLSRSLYSAFVFTAINITILLSSIVVDFYWISLFLLAIFYMTDFLLFRHKQDIHCSYDNNSIYTTCRGQGWTRPSLDYYGRFILYGGNTCIIGNYHTTFTSLPSTSKLLYWNIILYN